MGNFTAKNTILCLFLLANLLQAMSECGILTNYEIHVVNNLPDTLRLHCASGDDDFGFHNLNPKDDFHWRFCDSYLGRTLFFCHFFWGSKDVAFDVFKSYKTKCPRGGCYYEAKPDGIYFSGYYPPGPLEKVNDWKNGKVE